MSTDRRLQSAHVARTLPFPNVSQRANLKMTAANDQENLFDTILNNLSQGVLMFDAGARLVFCNRRYIEMYGLSPDAAKSGCTLRDLLDQRIAARTFAGNPKKYISKLLHEVTHGKEFNDIARLNDGRVFSIVNKPLPNGGWLATHEDITERRRAEEQIAHMARHDALTDLPNRVLLRERLEDELKTRQTRGMPGGFLPRSRPVQGRQ